MMHKALLTTALAATLLLLLGASGASASRSYEIRNSGASRGTTSALTFTEEGSGRRIICNVTLTGSINRNLIKARGQQFGSISEARTETCRDEEGRTEALITFLVETRAPWNLQYETFEGSLPSITNLLFSTTASFEIRRKGTFFSFTTCLYRGRLGFNGNVTAVEIRTLRVQIPNRIPLFRVEEEEVLTPCEGEGRLS